MVISIKNVLFILNENLKDLVENTNTLTTQEHQLADEIEQILRQAAANEEEAPWVERTTFLDFEVECPAMDVGDHCDGWEFEGEVDGDLDSPEATFEYRKECVAYWLNEDGLKRRSITSVESKFKLVKR